MTAVRENPVSPFLQPTYVMQNGYFGGITMDSTNLNCVQIDHEEEVPVSIRRSVDLGYITSTNIDNDYPQNNTEETEVVRLCEERPRYIDMSAQMKEYNVNYSGLVIIPWDEFAENPRKINDLFYLEKDGLITYDTEEVNVFFHATKMNKPTFGDISENGKAWVVNVESIRDLEQVRVWLLERISVFGVTLVKKTSRFGKSDRAPCLVMLDPTMGHSDSIHAAIMRCINIMQGRKKFCLEIDLNGCVERWCRRITMTKCEAVGAKLVITNGEERADMTDTENIICCVICFPIWSIRAGIYKLQRNSQYKDFQLKFDGEDLFLYGTYGSVQNQRAKLFKDFQKEIFRTKPIDEAGEVYQGLQNRHKYISVKKAIKEKNSENYCYIEYVTTDMNDLLTKDNDKLKEKFQDTLLQSYNHTSSPPNKHSPVVQHETLSTSTTDIFYTSEIKHLSGSRQSLDVNSDINRLDLREDMGSVENFENTCDGKNSNIQSFLEVDSCSVRKPVSPIQSARTVNSDIMIITQFDDQESRTGSEIDLKTFLQTELNNPPPKKYKKKSKKNKGHSKPPKPPRKKKSKTNKFGVDNTAFDDDSENKFRRILPSKRRSLESINTIDTIESNDNLHSDSSYTTLQTGSRDSLDTMMTQESIENIPTDTEVISLSPDAEIEVNTLANENDEKIFQINDKLHRDTMSCESEHAECENYQNNINGTESKVVLQDNMACNDLEISDFEDDEQTEENNVSYQNISKVRHGSRKQNNIRCSAPYKSRRQKYIGMNTAAKK